MTSPWFWRGRPDGHRASAKINFRKVANFSTPFKCGQATTFYHATTTFLPSKNHAQTPTFPETPLKNTSKTTQKSLPPACHFFSHFCKIKISF
jgi:hypothetical protein